jgi:uncharacterized membrane protein YccC
MHPLLADPVRFDLGRLTWLSPLRCAVVAAGVTATALTLGDARVVLPLVLGALFVGLNDAADSLPRRLASMGWTTVGCSAAAVAGGWASVSIPVHVVAGAAVAALCAYVGVLGPRAAMAGVLSLVTFLVFAGTAGESAVAVRDGLMVLAGGSVQVAVAVLVALATGTDIGPRQAVALGYRHLFFGAIGHHRFRVAAEHAAVTGASFGAAHDAATRSVAGPQTIGWLEELVDLGQQAQLGVVALLDESRRRQTISVGEATPAPATPAPAAPAPDTLQAASNVARQIARAMVVPWRKRSLDHQLGALDTARRRDLEAGWPPLILDAIVEPLAAAGRAVAGTWPRRTRRPQWPPANPGPSLRSRLAPQATIVNHTVRLSVAVGLGILVANTIDVVHSSWLPLTVAWVARPDLGNTLSRVVLRVLGTLAGASAMAAVFTLTDPGVLGLALLVGVGALVANAFITVNYATAVVGITTIMLTMLASIGESVDGSLPLRLAATVAGGALVAAAALVRPQRSTGATTTALADAANRLHAYAVAVFGGTADDERHNREATQQSCARAGETLAANDREPGGRGLAPGAGQHVLEGIMVCTAYLLVTRGDTTRQSATTTAARPAATSPTLPATTPAIDRAQAALLADIEALEHRLRAIAAGTPIPPWQPQPDGGVPAALAAAHAAIDPMPGHP